MPSRLWCRLLLPGVVCAVFWTIPSFAQDHTLDWQALLARADSASPVLAEALVELAAAKATYTSSRALPNPFLFVNSEQLDGHGGDVTENTLGIRQNLGFLWTQSSRRSSAKAGYAASQAKYEERRRQVHREILLSALRYRQLHAERNFVDTLAALGHRLNETAAARLKAGDISRYDAERMELEQIELGSRQAELLQNKQAELIRLMELTGLPAADLEDVRELPVLPAPFADESAALSYAREHRPRLREQEQAAKSAAGQLTASRLDVLPDLNLGIGRKSVDPDLDGTYLEADLEIPIFGQRRSAISRARAEKDAAAVRSAAGQRVVEQEVRSAFVRWKQTNEIPGGGFTVDRAHRNLRLAETLYMNGEIGSWELIDALRTSIGAMAAVHSLELLRADAALELRRVTGYPLLEN